MLKAQGCVPPSTPSRQSAVQDPERSRGGFPRGLQRGVREEMMVMESDQDPVQGRVGQQDRPCSLLFMEGSGLEPASAPHGHVASGSPSGQPGWMHPSGLQWRTWFKAALSFRCDQGRASANLAAPPASRRTPSRVTWVKVSSSLSQMRASRFSESGNRQGARAGDTAER